MAAREDDLYIARRVSELSAKVRNEDASSIERKRRFEAWEREADRHLREMKSDTAESLTAYARACGFSAESERLMLFVMAHTRGADRLTNAPDWMMGLRLAGGTTEDLARIESLRGNATEKRTLAQRWKRAWLAFDAEQERAGFDSIKRQPGTKDFRTGKKHASRLHALFVQHLVEMERIAKSTYKVKRFERFDRAARDVVKAARCEHPRQPEIPREPRKSRINPAPDVATLQMRALRKIGELVDELKERGALSEDLLIQMHARLDEKCFESETTPKAQGDVILNEDLYLSKEVVKQDEVCRQF
jgi:hypothetical protein